MKLVPKEEITRNEFAGSITKRNGAWLVWGSDNSGESTPDEYVDCASNEVTARKLLRAIAISFNFTDRSLRWKRKLDESGRPIAGWWELYGTHTIYWEQWEDEEEDEHSN